MFEIVACPDCREKLLELDIDDKHVGFLCEKCCVIFPAKDNIAILLPARARNYNLEHSLVDSIRQEAMNRSMGWPEECFAKTLNLLSSCQNRSTWEWEDEQHWSRAYAKESKAVVRRKWNDRIWQREFLVKSLASQTSLRGKIILDVGCGEGQTFRSLMTEICDDRTLYVATDISLAGLELNRTRNRHKNSLYVLCSTDSLPFQRGTIDILCYFGILHHTERKDATISDHSDLLKSGGYMLIHEALSRPSPPLLGFLTSKAEKSAHEERLREDELLPRLYSKELEIIASRRMHTAFFTGMMFFLGNIMTTSRTFFRFISVIDIGLVKSIGYIIPFFRAGETMLVLRKS